MSGLTVTYDSLVSQIAKHEGFEMKPYADPVSGGEPWTFGHGLTYITEEESLHILEGRVDDLIDYIHGRYARLLGVAYDSYGDAGVWVVLCVLIEMAYQLGRGGLAKFEKFLAALNEGHYDLAAYEMLDSKWAKQTPARAEKLARTIREIGRD